MSLLHEDAAHRENFVFKAVLRLFAHSVAHKVGLNLSARLDDSLLEVVKGEEVFLVAVFYTAIVHVVLF